jgi:hypothetical protein
MVRAVEGSLARLRTDRIDLLWVHFPDTVTPVGEIVRALDDLVRSGKILYAGLSNFPAWRTARAVTLAELRGWAPIVGVQFEYSLVERSADLRCVGRCRRDRHRERGYRGVESFGVAGLLEHLVQARPAAVVRGTGNVVGLFQPFAQLCGDEFGVDRQQGREQLERVGLVRPVRAFGQCEVTTPVEPGQDERGGGGQIARLDQLPDTREQVRGCVIEDQGRFLALVSQMEM